MITVKNTSWVLVLSNSSLILDLRLEPVCNGWNFIALFSLNDRKNFNNLLWIRIKYYKLFKQIIDCCLKSATYQKLILTVLWISKILTHLAQSSTHVHIGSTSFDYWQRSIKKGCFSFKIYLLIEKMYLIFIASITKTSQITKDLWYTKPLSVFWYIAVPSDYGYARFSKSRFYTVPSKSFESQLLEVGKKSYVYSSLKGKSSNRKRYAVKQIIKIKRCIFRGLR